MNFEFPLGVCDVKLIRKYDERYNLNILKVVAELKKIMDTNTSHIHSITSKLESYASSDGDIIPDLRQDHQSFITTLESAARLYLEMTESYDNNEYTSPIFRKLAVDISRRTFFGDVFMFNMLSVKESGTIPDLKRNIRQLLENLRCA